MTRVLWPVAILLTLGGCGGGNIDGTLVDGLSGAPIGGVEVVASADGQVRLTCQKVSAVTADDGTFSISGTCLGDSSYTLSTNDENLWLGDVSSVPQDGFEGPKQIKAWRAPVGSGVYSLMNDTLSVINTATDIKQEKLYLTDPPEMVSYPDEIKESKVGLVEAGGYLVLSSKDNCDGLQLYPLIEDKIEDKPEGDTRVRRFGDKETWADMNPWWYVGYRFASDTEWEKVDAKVDTSKVITQSNDKHTACFYPHGVVAPGRYALMKEGAKRLYLVDFK